MSDITVSLTPATSASIDLTPPSSPATITLSVGSTGPGVPIGGTVRQLVQKASATDFDVEWTSDILVDSVQLSGGVDTQGTVTWDVDEQTLELVYNSAVLHVGQDTLYQVRNSTASQITKGTVVMATGTVGNSGKITIGPMDGTSVSNAKFLLGIATENIAAGADGKVTSFGKIRQLNTAAYLDGDVLYVSTATAGALTKTEPTSGLKLPIAFVIHAHSNGTLMVRAGNGSAIRDQHDVTLTSIATNDILMRDGANWVNKTPAQVRDIYDLVPGTDIQAYDAGLQSIAGLTTAADRMIYTTALDTYAVTTLTSFARTLLDDTDAATARTTLGAGTVTSVAGTGTVNGITLTGTVTASGSLTLGGTLSGVSLTTQVSGTLPAANGGTGNASYTIGDILYASGATALAKLADVATGNALLSGGVGVAPAWGKVGLTTHISGTLAVANGGTGITAFGTGVATALGQNVTGSGGIVLATSPTLVTPALGTPSALVGTNITGTAAGLTAGTVTTNANLTGAVTSVGNATSLGSFTSAALAGALTDETGSGAAVFGTSPTLAGTIVDSTTNLVTNANVGTEPNELTLNANLGGMAYQSPESVVIKPQAVATPNGIGDLVFQATSDSVIEMEYKGSDGTVRTAQIPMSNERLATLANVNPLAMAIRVAMTVAASGSNGIQVADDDDIDFGTGDFFLHWEGSLPDWTPAANVPLILKWAPNTGYFLAVRETGIINVRINGTSYDATSAVSNIANDIKKITCSIVRETASSAGVVNFYANGSAVGSPVSISLGAPATVSSANAFYCSGNATTRTASTTLSCIVGNRALSAAEVLSLYNNGPALADLYGKQLELVTDGSFSLGDTGWTKDAGVTIVDQGGGDFEAVFTASGVNNEFWRAPVENIATGRYRVTYTITSYTAGTFRPNIAGVVGTIRSSAGTFTEEIEITTIGAQRVGIRGLSASNTARVDDFSVVRVGITGWWDARDAQSNTGQIFDSSSNKNHAMLPASGATVIGKPLSEARQVRWTNTWTGTQELQYIGGVNQAVLPAKAYIESIVGIVSGATVEDIIIGDGSSGNRYVTITTGLAAGTVTFTLANRTTDGTNLKLTVDPDANATMSIIWTVTYRILE